MDHENILSELKQKRGEEGEQREQADYLKIVEEFPEGSQERQDAEDQEEDRSLGAVLNRGVRDEARLFFRKLSIHQGEREADIASKATDAEQQTIEAMKPVRAEVKFMSGLGQNLPSGLRGFTRNYAYWLRRSCLFRPCNASLDRILKIILEDSCFPYVSGAYLGDSEEHERQDTCREDAEL